MTRGCGGDTGRVFVLVMRLRPLLTIHSGHSPAGLIIALERLWRSDKQAKGDVSYPSLQSQTNVLLAVSNGTQRGTRPHWSTCLNAEFSHVLHPCNDALFYPFFFLEGRKMRSIHHWKNTTSLVYSKSKDQNVWVLCPRVWLPKKFQEKRMWNLPVLVKVGQDGKDHSTFFMFP